CPVYEIYSSTKEQGQCAQIIAIEQYAFYPWLCMERCLDIPGCRAINHYVDVCSFYHCDCSEPNSANGLTFILITNDGLVGSDGLHIISSRRDHVLPGGGGSDNAFYHFHDHNNCYNCYNFYYNDFWYSTD
ncbi:hypothetical protein MAR_034217, partial [Mya arenaria]